jgi:hypothetical protein
MNNETAFLDCNIWSVHLINQPYIQHNFFLVENVYHYNSLTSGIIVFNPNCIQIPEFEIKDLHLLDKLDYDLINKHTIPVLYKDDACWKINLSVYNEYDKNTNM